MVPFGEQMSLPLQVQIPNCDDPVFRAWCRVCELVPGEQVDVADTRLARLQRLMVSYGFGSYDPESDTDDDYLDPFPHR